MKIDEKMIEQMTEREQEELFKLLQEHQNKKRQEKISKLLKELQDVINKLVDEDVGFDYNTGDLYNQGYYSQCYVEQQLDGNVLFTFCE